MTASQAISIPYTTEAAWLAARAQDVTSTESAALFGMSPYVTEFTLWHRKRDNLQADFKANDRMQWGNRLEAAIAAGIAEEQGWEIRPMKQYMRLPDERIGASFDFEILNHPDGPAHLEIKNVDYLAFRDGWVIDDDGFAEAPEHIEMQVQHQMLVSGYKRSFIGALVGGNRSFLIERERDEPVIKAIRAKIAAFWKSVDDGIEPPPVMPDDASAVIHLNQYAQPGKVLDATSDEELAVRVAAYRHARDAAKQANEDAEAMKAELLIAIGDAERVIGPDWSISASITAETPPTVITQAMVGQEYGGRKGYRNFRVNSRKAK